MTQFALLDPDLHRHLRIRTEFGAELGDAVMAAITVPDEFRMIQGQFPILFRKEPGERDFMALALLGFKAGENLFLKDNRWEATYRPWSLSVQPFLVGRSEEDEGEAQVHIDLAHPRLTDDAEEGLAIFTDNGEVSPYLDQVVKLLSALDAGFQITSQFFETLLDYDLLEPLMLNLAFADGSEQDLTGFHVINEQRVAELDGEALGRLQSEGFLQPIYMALASLSQLTNLVNRKNRLLA